MKKTITSNKIINFSIIYLIMLFQVKDILTSNQEISNSIDSSVEKSQKVEGNQNDAIKSDVPGSSDGKEKFSYNLITIPNQQKLEEMEKLAQKIKKLEESLNILEGNYNVLIQGLQEKQRPNEAKLTLCEQSINLLSEDINKLKESGKQPPQAISEEDFKKLKSIVSNDKEVFNNLQLEVSKVQNDLLKNKCSQEYVYWVYGGIFFSGICLGAIISAIDRFVNNKKNKNIQEDE